MYFRSDCARVSAWCSPKRGTAPYGAERITNVPSTPNAILGKALTGDMILEVPVQNRAVPAGVQNLANRLEITIRDPNGRVYNTPPRN
jgi:hypothetical protein